MRWTYTLLIVIYFLTTAQSIALPIGSTVGNADTDQLWGREPAKRRPKSNFVRAKDLKQSTYRKKAINKAKAVPGSGWSHHDERTHQADHILEAQTVSNYLNKHLNGRPLDRDCKLAIRKHLNHPNNLKMVISQDNQSKGQVVTALIKNPHNPGKQFSHPVKGHIHSNSKEVLDTARSIDELLESSRECASVLAQVAPHIRQGHHGVRDAAQAMIIHAHARH